MDPIVLALLALGIGGGLGYAGRIFVAKNTINSAEGNAIKIIEDAKSQEKDILLSAKDKALKIVDEAKTEERSIRQQIQDQQKRIEKREGFLDQKLIDLEKKQNSIQDQASKLDVAKKEIQKIRDEQWDKLQKIASLTKDEAKALLIETTESEVKEELLGRIRKLEQENYEELEKKAKTLLAVTLQRCAFSQASEMSSTNVDLPSDEMKGRIIGKEGRNIRMIEKLTGVEVLIDDTPEMITISGFSPLRRHLAKRVIEKLMVDGRVHPSRIEKEVEEVKQGLATEIKKAGEEAAYKAGVSGLDPKLLQILGRLRYRTSYGQNVLQHSIEVAHISAMLAKELGADPNVARKGGLLHDIGKAVDHEMQGSHVELGVEIGKKFGLSEEVIAPIAHHHDDKPPTLESIIVKVADALSGARPGARKDSYENFVQRLSELEDLAKGFDGVDKAYAIQAGREVRVFVSPNEIDDYSAHKLARSIAEKIEKELKYPGEIKVTLHRDMQIVEYAR